MQFLGFMSAAIISSAGLQTILSFIAAENNLASLIRYSQLGLNLGNVDLAPPTDPAEGFADLTGESTCVANR